MDKPQGDEKPNHIIFDNTCISCEKTPIQKQFCQKAYKMACLQYQPTKVDFNGQEFER
jgi:hypothetical protein